MASPCFDHVIELQSCVAELLFRRWQRWMRRVAQRHLCVREWKSRIFFFLQLQNQRIRKLCSRFFSSGAHRLDFLIFSDSCELTNLRNHVDEDVCVWSLSLSSKFKKVLANTKWGANKNTLLHLYRSSIRSKLDYSCILYRAARTSCIKALYAMHHHGLRLCTGAYRTSLYVEANEPPLDLRRVKLLLQYIIKLKANSDNPAFRCVFHPQFENLYDKNKNCIKAVGLRIIKNIYRTLIYLWTL
jgi:hypothetical protein